MAKTVQVPMEVAKRVQRLGERIRLARKRRSLSAADLALKAGIHRHTLLAVERGAIGPTVGAVATLLWALNLDSSLEAVAAPDADVHGKTLEAARLPKRIRKQAKKNEYDF